MLILNMIIRITGFIQEKLAVFLGVSRASVNSWLTDDSSMTELSKKNIANKYKFPVSYFDIDLYQNINMYKLIFTTLYDNWNRINSNFYDNNDISFKINKILNDVESDIKNTNDIKVSDMEIIDGLVNGYNPYTGEVFDSNHILNDFRIKKLMIKFKDNYKYGSNITKNDLDKQQSILFEKLRLWRKNKYIEEGFFKCLYCFQ